MALKAGPKEHKSRAEELIRQFDDAVDNAKFYTGLPARGGSFKTAQCPIALRSLMIASELEGKAMAHLRQFRQGYRSRWRRYKDLRDDLYKVERAFASRCMIKR